MYAARHFAGRIKVRDPFSEDIKDFSLRGDAAAALGADHGSDGREDEERGLINLDKLALARGKPFATELRILSCVNVAVVVLYGFSHDLGVKSGFLSSFFNCVAHEYVGRAFAFVN